MGSPSDVEEQEQVQVGRPSTATDVPADRVRQLPPGTRVRRAVTLLLMTLPLPGLAQLTAGHRQVGRWSLRLWATGWALVALTGLVWLVDDHLVLSLLTRPAVLTLLGLVCYAGALAFAGLLVDAWRLGRPHLLPRRARIWVAALTALLVLVTVVPLVGVGRRAGAAADAIGSIFAGDGQDGGADGRYNVLLLGGDAGKDRVGTRPDSMTLASIDAATGRTSLFSLPRNMQNIPFPAGTPAARALPDGWSCGDTCLLNALYTWGGEHRDLFPGAKDPGAEAMKQAVQGVTGLKVDYYVLIDLKGFEGLINAMGGVRVSVTAPVPIGGETSPISGYIPPGTRTLDGYHALWFARSRTGASDYARMARQRCVMDAMLHQMDPQTVLRNFQAIAAASTQVVSTDVPAGDLATFIDLAREARSQKVTSVQFVPPLVNPTHPDFAALRGVVERTLKGEDDGSRASSTARASSSRAVSSQASSSQASSSQQSSSPAGTPPSAATSSGAPSQTDDVHSVCAAA